MEIEIGRGKKGRRAYGFDDIAIVPSQAHPRPRRHRHLLEARALPVRAADARLRDGRRRLAETAGIVGHLGGLAVLNLEGIFTRYEDADEQLERIATLPKELATREMQEIYPEPVKAELIAQRIAEIKEQKVVVAASLTPQRVLRLPRDRARGGPRRARHPGHRRLRRARLDGLRAAEPEGVHPHARRAGGRRRLRLLPHGPAPDAHRRGRRARRRRPRARPARRAACSGSACRRRPRSPTWPTPAPRTCSRPASTAR